MCQTCAKRKHGDHRRARSHGRTQISGRRLSNTLSAARSQPMARATSDKTHAHWRPTSPACHHSSSSVAATRPDEGRTLDPEPLEREEHIFRQTPTMTPRNATWSLTETARVWIMHGHANLPSSTSSAGCVQWHGWMCYTLTAWRTMSPRPLRAPSPNKPRFRPLQRRLRRAHQYIHSLTDHCPVFFELKGRGSVMGAAHGCRSNLDNTGVDALDLRTANTDGRHRKFTQACGRQEARMFVDLPGPPGSLDPLRALPPGNSMCTGTTHKRIRAALRHNSQRAPGTFAS